MVTANQIDKCMETGTGTPIAVKITIDSLSLKKLQKEKVFTKCFPLHDGPAHAEEGIPLTYMNDRAYLNEKWSKGWIWERQPIERIRQYFGEKLALYFAWLGLSFLYIYYTRDLRVKCKKSYNFGVDFVNTSL